MKIAAIASMEYTKGNLNYFQFIRGGVGVDCHQGPSFYQFKSGELQMNWEAYDVQECSADRTILYSKTVDGGKTWSKDKIIAIESEKNQLSNHSMIELDDERILHGISHYRAVFPISSDLDMAIYDEEWVLKE